MDGCPPPNTDTLPAPNMVGCCVAGAAPDLVLPDLLASDSKLSKRNVPLLVFFNRFIPVLAVINAARGGTGSASGTRSSDGESLGGANRLPAALKLKEVDEPVVL